MLRCPCEILKPFTLTTTKKTSVPVLRCNSVLKNPSGWSCYHRKGIFYHTSKNKQCSKRDWDFKKSIFKEQKSFIWTSFLFLKDKDNKNKNYVQQAPAEEKNKDKENESTVSSNESPNKTTSKKSPENAKENISQTHIFGPVDTVESSDFIKKPLGKEAEIKKPVCKTFESNNTKSTFFPTSGSSSDSKLGISIKSLPKAGTGSEPGGLKSSDPVTNDKSKPTDKSTEGNNNRQVCEIDLSDGNREWKLKEPPGTCHSDSLRTCDEIESAKEVSSNLLLDKAKKIILKTTSLKAEDSERNVKVVNLGIPRGDINLPTSTRRRQTVDLNRSSTERNFITPVRALTDFLLKPSDLEGLRKTKRRSPYENDPPITVYWRKDVEAKAIDVWGSKENLLKEILKRDIERRRYQQNLFTVKRRLRDFRREQGRESEIKMKQNGLFGSSGKVVLTAIAINGTNFMFKLLAWLFTGSHSMFSEAIHSLADTINQLILAYGIHKSVQRADSDHPYGYTNMRYVASLISGVGIFCVGSGLSIYHGIVGLHDPADLPSFYWAYFILSGSLVSEGATLLVAFNSIRLGARKSEMSFTEYVLRGQDPSVNVVFLEDFAAVIGVCFAGCCMGLSSYYMSHIPDAIGSFFVGGLLAGVASFIIYTNVAALVGRSIPQERLDKINSELESDVMIRAIHDVKGIDIGNSLVRYKAEMDFDGGELTRSYLDKQDLNQMLEEVKKMQTIDELEEFMLRHGENIVDMMGGEIDRIELKLRKKHPEIRHCDLEIL